MEDTSRSIGIFDSGMGGLTVAHAIHRLLPEEHLIYYGDTKHLPYGEKSRETIQQYAIDIVKYLLSRNCKAIVIACNTASTAAGDLLKENFGSQVPIIDVVTPLVEKTISGQYRSVGIIATKATIESGAYQNALHQAKEDIEVVAKATPLLAPMIEEGFVEDEVARAVVNRYLKTGEFDGVQCLLLACTHYPLVRSIVEKVLPGVDILDSTEVTALTLQKVLMRQGLLSGKNIQPNQFVVTDFTINFEKQAKVFFGEEIHLTKI